jgi:hypothetical protein
MMISPPVAFRMLGPGFLGGTCSDPFVGTGRTQTVHALLSFQLVRNEENVLHRNLNVAMKFSIETVFHSIATDKEEAYLPFSMHNISHSKMGRTWAGSSEGDTYVGIFELEGDLSREGQSS